MYKDELWYQQLLRDVDAHRMDFTDKQVRAYQVDLLLRIALRVKELSDACETCRSFQQILSHIEEEFPELPGSKAQRHHQIRQLRLMTEHFVKAHRLAPLLYYTHLYANYGLVVGLLFGIAVGLLVLNNGLYVPMASVAGLVLGGALGWIADARIRREQRVI